MSDLQEYLEHIAYTMDQAEEDPFTSTIEALRVMHSTISNFTPTSLKVLKHNSFDSNFALRCPVDTCPCVYVCVDVSTNQLLF